MAEEGADTELLDLRGLKCPLPALFARRRLLRGRSGEVVVVLADDPLAAVDIPHMCHRDGFAVLAMARSDSEVRITLQKPTA